MTHTKFLLFVLLICLLNGCQNPLKIKKYNDFNDKIDIQNDFVKKLEGFDIDYYSDTISKKVNEYFNFKSSAPISKGENGNYYYRWTLSIIYFEDHKSAVKAFNNMFREYDQVEDPMMLKGDNSNTILVQNKIFKISAGCLEGWHLQEWFELLLPAIIGKNDPDKNTIIRSNCGGTWELK